jgi:hypothetical protein
MSENIIYYHLYACNSSWERWLEEFISSLKNTLLTSNSQLHVCVQHKHKLYDPTNIRDIITQKYDNYIHNLSIIPNNFKYEGNTLKRLYDHANTLTSNAHILYAHSKGASRPITDTAKFPEKGRYDWRQMMNYFCIERYEDCFQKLDECDAVGCRLAGRPVRHFSGNYWWANSDYIKTLQDPSSDCRYKFRWKRLSCEFWIGNNTWSSSGKVIPGPGNLISMHQPAVRTMKHGYTEERYK